jgi:hypothetical protein
MKLYPDTAQMKIDLSEVVFEPGYIIPDARTIAASYQNGFDISEELRSSWLENNHGVAAEFILSYFRSQGDNSSKVFYIKDDPDCVRGVTVVVETNLGHGVKEYNQFTVWESSYRLYVEAFNRP